MSAQIIWNFLKEEGFNDYGVAGLMGNLDAESGLRSNNLQDTYSRKFGLSDTQYTQKVDNGTYTNFVKDEAGYGLAQWTYWSRKQNLLNYARAKNKSIGDLKMQLEFLCKELKEEYTNSVYNILKTATSLQQASDAVLMNFEKPLNAASQKVKRSQMGQVYYNQFAKGVENIMATNTYVKGQSVKLSANFNSTEFDCQGKGCCSQTIINPQLVKYLQKIREHFNVPITITSAYRCPTHNSRVGGAPGSRHSKGDAADVVVKGHSPREVAQYCESIGIKGIGLYETAADGYFVHIDTRDYQSFWYGQKEEKRTTFGGNSVTNITTNTTNNIATMIQLNDNGPVVKEIQEMLIELGYVLTDNPNDTTKGADGIFGMKTWKAVVDFQRKNNLDPDGVVGELTMEALEKATTKVGYNVKITANLLNVRSGPGMNNSIVGMVRKNATYKLLEIKDGWGRLSSPAGWISLSYAIAI